MKKYLLVGIMLLSAPYVSFAQTTKVTATSATGTVTITISDPGILPGDWFYFLDQWSEKLNLAFTFNNEKKAKKYLKYAKERTAEIDEVLNKPESTLESIEEIRIDLDELLDQVAGVVKVEKEKGIDVKDLARELDDELDDVQDALKNIFEEHEDEYAHSEEVIRKKLAGLSADDPQIKGLTQALESITKEKAKANKEGDDIDGELEDIEDLFEDIMGKETSAQKHIDEALRLRARLEGLAGSLPSDLVASSQALIDKANAANLRGDFEEAKKLSKQAKKVFEKAQDAIEKRADDSKESDDEIEMEMPSLDDDDVDEMEVLELEEEIEKEDREMEKLNR